MAAVAIHFTILDDKGKSSKTIVHVPTGFSIVQYGLFAQAMAQLIGDLSNGQITEVSVSLPLSLSGATIRAVAASFADIFKKVLFQARSSVEGLVGKFFIPTFDEQFANDNSDSVDLAETEVAALVSIIEDGVNVSGEIVQPVDLRGNDLAEISLARALHRKF